MGFGSAGAQWTLEAVDPIPPAGRGRQAQARRGVERKMMTKQERLGCAGMQRDHVSPPLAEKTDATACQISKFAPELRPLGECARAQTSVNRK